MGRTKEKPICREQPREGTVGSEQWGQSQLHVTWNLLQWEREDSYSRAGKMVQWEKAPATKPDTKV